MTGRGRTCDAPRFKRALYRLSYGHEGREGRVSVQLPSGSSTHMRPFFDALRVTCSDRQSDQPAMLSTPLAYPSTLNRRPGAAASYVEGCWSPVLKRCH